MEEDQSGKCTKNNKTIPLEYDVDDIPSLHITILYSLQQVVSNISGPLSTVYILHLTLCTEGRESGLLFAQLLSTSIFMMGVASLLQSTFGIRLPVLQGSSAAFVPPVIAMMMTDRWKCPPAYGQEMWNTTDLPIEDSLELTEPWIPRLREISGCLMVASLLQVIIGCTGVVGFLMNFIGPLTICPTLALVGLSLFETATAGAQHQWGIAILTIALVMLFSLVLCDIKIPLPSWKKNKGLTLDYFKIFKLFPHIFAIVISWLVCYILTVTNQFPDDPTKLGYRARTDNKLEVLYKANWFYIPYPLQWGPPTFSIGLFVGLVGATLATILESVGDYYATANVTQQRPPPKHAVNRGIALEGIASVMSGLVGAGHATTSYSATVGFIQITGVASRFVWQIMSLMLIACGIFGKFGAALTIMPDPIIGGLSVFGIGMVIPVGLSTLQYTNMNSPRNQLILAASFMLGMMIPFWMKDNPRIINTGNESVDQLLEVVLSTGMFVGGVLGFILDNLIPGTKEERGLIAYQEDLHVKDLIEDNRDKSLSTANTYDLPFVTTLLNRVAWCRHIPFLPSYVQPQFSFPCKSVKKHEDSVDSNVKLELTTDLIPPHNNNDIGTNVENI